MLLQQFVNAMKIALCALVIYGKRVELQHMPEECYLYNLLV